MGGVFMLGLRMNFNEFPRIGFAHHFHMDNYNQVYGKLEKTFELVYVKTGGITAILYGREYQIEPGSVMVLFRHLPIRLISADGMPQTHCTVQVMMDCEVELLDNESGDDVSSDGIIVPFITPPCSENELIKKQLYAIISSVAGGGNRDALSSALAIFGILSKLDNMYRHKLYVKKNTSSLLEYKIKRYIAEHMDKDIPLAEIAAAIGKTPNYLNSVFKSSTGMGIHQYISREKVRMICDLMENVDMPFKEACENVAISDVSYGYRLFKKYTGVTPKTFLSGARCEK